ncbi:oligopeptide/dipeptide ABC transporter ATP-binding protein [Brucella abortus]|nr:oligopeptide/dipeptide ABC transporter ATP-binding protein [Brucella abortus]
MGIRCIPTRWRALTSAVAFADPVIERKRQQILLKGDVPSSINPPSGCPFRTRCFRAQAVCAEVRPGIAENREAAMRWRATSRRMAGSILILFHQF